MRRYGAGETVFVEGSHGRSMFVVVEGSVQVLGNDQEVLTTLSAGQSFGEIALVDDGVRTATVRAAEAPTCLVEIDKARFVFLVGQQPAFALTILKGMARRIKALSEGKTALPAKDLW